VVMDWVDGQLRHLPLSDASGHSMVDILEGLGADASSRGITDGVLVRSGPLSGYVVYRSKAQDGFHLCKDGYFLCAEAESGVLICDRLTPGPSELFMLTGTTISAGVAVSESEEVAVQEKSYPGSTGAKLGSLKSSLDPDVILTYQRVLADLATKEFTLIEFCANSSESLAGLVLWKDLYPHSRIITVTADEDYAAIADSTYIVKADFQKNEAFLWHLVQTYSPSVIIDGASRYWRDQLYCFKTLYPMLSSAGIYIIRGLQTSQAGQMEVQFGSKEGERTTNFIADVAAAVAEDDNHHGPRWGFASAITLVADLTDSVEISPRTSAFRRRGNPYVQHLIVSAKDGGDRSWELNNGGPYTRHPPNLVNARGMFGDAVNRQLDQGIVYPPIARVTQFSNATIMMNGVILTHDSRVVDESLYGIQQLERVGRYCRLRSDSPFCYIDITKDNCTIIEEDVVILKQWNDANYGHWLFENFSRICLIYDLFDLTKLRFIITEASGPMRNVYLAALGAVGVTQDQIIETSHRPVLVRSLIFPSPLTVHPWRIAPRVIEFLEAVGRIIDPTPQGPKRVYVSRNQFGRRGLQNELDLVKRLQGLGFTVLNCENLGFLDQVKAFGNAEIVVGNQGAALSNIAFSPRGVKLLALTNEFMGDNWFWDLANHKRGKYVSLHGKATRPELGMQSDFTIDIDRAISLISAMEPDAL
jgi:capsular polysaccharide biosynthesis protein